MSTINLLKYQENLKIEMRDDFITYLNTRGKNNFLFSSPTGSGKTVVAGLVVKELLRDERNIFVWISIGMGDNAEQSYKSFLNLLNFEEEDLYLFDNLYPIPEEKTVIFASWSYLKTKTFNDEKIKISNYLNSFKEKEGSFIEHFKQLKKAGKRIFLITDEAHHTADSELSQDIIKDLDPTIYLEITATPNKEKQYTRTYLPDPAEVEKSGIIKNLISINPYESNSSVINEEDFILSSANKMREKIFEEYKKVEPGNTIQPLVLIQCQNSKMDDFEEKLILLGIDKNDIALIFDKVKRNHEDITDLNSNVKFLLCNQAIATGWDCPRAHILVQFIKVGSENFQIQVVGRISRTANHKLYNNPIIDTAYVYTYFAENKKYIEEYEKSKELTIPIKCELNVIKNENLELLNKQFEELKIKKETIETKELKNLLTNFDRVKSLQLDFFDFVEQRRNKLSISQKYINYKKQINNHSVGTIYSSESNNVVNLTVSFDIYCKEMIAKHSLSRVIYDTLIIYYKERAKLSNDDMAEGLFEVTKEFEISQSKKIKSISEDVFKLKDHYEIPKGADFIFLKNTHGSINTESKVVFQQKLSTPEELFIKNFLDVDKGNIKCWFKNFDNGDNSLSFVYQINNELHIHTPDFICLDNNNKLKLFEVKDNTLAETTSNINRAKFNALSDLLKQNNFSFSYDIMFVSQKQILQMGHSQNNII
jgi:type III restriction enzyme